MKIYLYVAKIQGSKNYIIGFLNSVYGGGYDSVKSYFNPLKIEYIHTDTVYKINLINFLKFYYKIKIVPRGTIFLKKNLHK